MMDEKRRSNNKRSECNHRVAFCPRNRGRQTTGAVSRTLCIAGRRFLVSEPETSGRFPAQSVKYQFLIASISLWQCFLQLKC